LAALPLVLSAETIRAELAARIEAATGRATRIDGPVSFGVIPTAHLSAEGIGIAGLASDTEDFSVESVSFGLSLLPLITGNIEIHGVTITRPSVLVETHADGRTNWTNPDAGGEAAPRNIEDMIATNESEPDSTPRNTLAVLDRLSIGRVTIADGTLIWRDLPSGREVRLEDIDLDIRVPRLDGAGTIEGSFVSLGVAQSLEVEIGERPNPTILASIPINLTLSADAGTIVAQGTAMAGEALFDGSIETEGKSLVAFAKAYGIDLPDMPVFGVFDTATRLTASTGQIRIDEFAIDLGGLRARGGAVVRLDRSRPGAGLKIAADTVDTALFVAKADASGGGDERPSAPAGSENVDFAALHLLDANIDLSAKEVLIGAVPVSDLGVDIQVVNGVLSARVRSATVNGAPASGTVAIDTGGEAPAIKGDIKVDGLDAAGLIALSGMDLPIDRGAVGADVSFATRGVTQNQLAENLDGGGRISLANAHVGGLDIAGLVGGDESANEIDDLDLTAEFSSLSAPVDAKGGFGWRGERFTIAGRTDPRAFASGGTTPVSVNASSQRVDLGFDGEAGLSGLGSGTVSLSTPSLRDLLAWIGQPLTAGGGLGAFSIKGAVALDEGAFSFDKADFTLDGSNGVGTGKVTFGSRPRITAGLSMKRLDVTSYLMASGSAGGSGTATGSTGSGSGWSTDPIGFDGLRAIDANLNLKADEIVADQIRIGPSLLKATIDSGKLNAELTEMSLYSGIGVGVLSVDGSSSTPSLEASFRLDGIDALPLLRDAAGFSWVEGTGSLSFDVRSAGASEAALMAALDGKGSLDFRNGAIHGIDIPKMVRSLSVETLLGWQQSGNEKTDFSQLSGTYTIKKGILTNRDLMLTGPLLRVTGAGTVDIPNRTLAYRVDPKVVSSLEGQGGSQDLEGFAVPVRVEGPWGRPRIYPEIEGILQDPQKALDQLRKLGGGLFGQKGSAEPPAGSSTGRSVEDRINEEISKGLGKLLGGSGAADSGPPAAPTTAVEEAPSQEATAPPGLDVEAPPAERPLPEPAPPGGQPEATQPPADPPSPLDLLLGRPAATETAPEENSSGSQQGTPAPAGDAGPGDPQPTDQAVDLLKSLFGQ
jgi:AsmA protein